MSGRLVSEDRLPGRIAAVRFRAEEIIFPTTAMEGADAVDAAQTATIAMRAIVLAAQVAGVDVEAMMIQTNRVTMIQIFRRRSAFPHHSRRV